MTQISNDYFAGLFDGEGWFNISRSKGSLRRSTREWSYQCSTNLTMREKSLVLELQKRFGGKVCEVKERSEKHSKYYSWRLSGLDSLKFCKEMKNHLIAKQDQALLLIKFQEEKVLNGNQSLPDLRYEFYGKCFDEMKILNQKGVGKQ